MGLTSTPVHLSRSSPASGPTPVIFVVDDDASVRKSLEMLIDAAGWQTATFASGREFLSHPRVSRSPGPRCLVLDLSLPDIDGLELQRQVAMDHAEMPIIFISGHGDVPTTVKAMRAGAMEFLTKPLGSDELLGAIGQAIERSNSALQQQVQLRMVRERHASLSPREREVMALVVAGLLNKQVGSELGISEITVKAHRGRMMRKMQARSLPALVNMAALLNLPALAGPSAKR